MKTKEKWENGKLYIWFKNQWREAKVFEPHKDSISNRPISLRMLLVMVPLACLMWLIRYFDEPIVEANK